MTERNMPASMVLQGHVLEVLKDIPDEFFNCVITSPPYWGLRDYGLESIVWGGDMACRHEWIDRIIRTYQSDGNFAGHWQAAGGGATGKNRFKGNIDAARQKKNSINNSAFCSLCGAWRGQLGLEPTFQLYIEHLMMVFAEVKRVLRKDGCCFVNLGDSYGGGGTGGHTDHKNKKASGAKSINSQPKSLCQIPSRFGIAMTDAGWILRNELIWHKRNCLNGGTRLYAKTQKGTMPSTLKDLVRLDPATVQLWGGVKWNTVIDWVENKNPQDIKRITMRSGETISCTGDHVFPICGVNKKANELKIGDIIDSCALPDNTRDAVEYIPDDIGWFVGIYLAEGSMSKECIQISGHERETERFSRLSRLVTQYDGTCRLHTKCRSGKSASINIYSPVLRGILDTYIEGKTAKDKHLSSRAWRRGNGFIREVLAGYLEGDGYNDMRNRRWRIGFTRNDYWAYDLRCICARLGYKIKLAKRTSVCQTGIFKIYKGEIRMVESAHHNVKSQNEIIKIVKGKQAGKFWDIVLESEPHLFSTISGTLIHNCMPSSAKDRFTVDFEYVYFFTKSGKYWFEQQKEPYTAPLDRWGGDDLKADGESSWDKGTGQSSYRDRNMRPDPQGRNKRCVWDIPTKPFPEAHFAVFPDTLVEPMIKAGCPEDGWVLDPFAGAGTVGVVAKRQGKNFIGMELNPEYVMMAERRIGNGA